MSNPSPSRTQFIVTLSAIIAGLLVFAILVAAAYWPQKPAALAEGQLTPEERVARLTELRGKEKTESSTYAWIDKEKGIVRLPISRAVELTIADLNAKK